LLIELKSTYLFFYIYLTQNFTVLLNIDGIFLCYSFATALSKNDLMFCGTIFILPIWTIVVTQHHVRMFLRKRIICYFF